MVEQPQIKILSSECRGKVFTLGDDEYLVGRIEEVDIQIPNEAVSSRHCRLTKSESGDYIITDLDSTNGTTVNGRTVQTAALIHGDIVRLGGIEVLYESPNKPPVSEDTRKPRLGIDIRTTAGTSTVSETPNFSPFGSGSGHHRTESSMVSKALAISLAGLSIILVVILLILLLKSL